MSTTRSTRRAPGAALVALRFPSSLLLLILAALSAAAAAAAPKPASGFALPTRRVAAASRSPSPPRPLAARRARRRRRRRGRLLLDDGRRSAVPLAASRDGGGAAAEFSADGGAGRCDFDMPSAEGFYVRSARFQDLKAAADMFVDSFYDSSSLLRHYYRMLELDRIQSNFPYDAAWHDYYVACSSSEDSVIAFVDVDARKLPKRWGLSAPPRPYLSDLAVRSDWRRRRVATRLVVRCEDKAREMGYRRLYLRVERDNAAALGYEVRRHPYFGVKDTLPEKSRLLEPKEPRREEEESKEETGGDAERSASSDDAPNGADVVLDYVV